MFSSPDWSLSYTPDASWTNNAVMNVGGRITITTTTVIVASTARVRLFRIICNIRRYGGVKRIATMAAQRTAPKNGRESIVGWREVIHVEDNAYMCEIVDGLSDALAGPTETLIEHSVIADVAQAVGRPALTTVIDLGDRTVMPGFIAENDGKAKLA
jgi:hypothetical protein